MKPGDLVLMSFPRGMLQLPLFKQWNGQIGILVEEVDARYNERFWSVLCAGEIKILAGSHLKALDAPVRPAGSVIP
jgi:hypothetical protein